MTRSTVGILGGGQLARMLALSGAPLGLRLLVMDTVADACAGQFAPLLVGDYRDQQALAQFAEKVDVATFDFENVPAESAEWLAARVPVFPSPRALAVAQDRLAEKTLFRELDIPVPEFAAVASRQDLDRALADVAVLTGVEVAAADVLDSLLVRWDGTLPPFTPAYRARTRRLVTEAHSRPGLAVCGAWVAGTGIASTVTQARVQAVRLAEQ